MKIKGNFVEERRNKTNISLMKKQLFFSSILILINIISFAQSADTTKKYFIEYKDHHRIYWKDFHQAHYRYKLFNRNDAYIDDKKINLLDNSIIAIQNKHGYHLKINYGMPVYRKGGKLAFNHEYAKRIICGKINVFKRPGYNERDLFYSMNDSIIKKFNNDTLLVDVKDNPESVKYVQRAVKADRIYHYANITGTITFLNFFPVSIILEKVLKKGVNIFNNGIYSAMAFGLFTADEIFCRIIKGSEQHYQLNAIKKYNNMAK
jgi:hypothetical protein